MILSELLRLNPNAYAYYYTSEGCIFLTDLLIQG